MGQRLYFPSEGRRAEDFFALKNPKLRPGLNPRTLVPKASTLPLDHRSRYKFTNNSKLYENLLNSFADVTFKLRSCPSALFSTTYFYFRHLRINTPPFHKTKIQLWSKYVLNKIYSTSRKCLIYINSFLILY